MEPWQISKAFSAVGWENEQLQAVVAILEQSVEIEKLAVCQSNLTAESRAYNCGRMAMIEDLKSVIRQAWQEAQATNSPP